jgi:hypothetical protein
MPTTLEALAIFACAVAPGYGFLSGYQHRRSHSAPERDLYVLAQAFILSAAWVALTWWPIGHLLSNWAAEEKLASHELAVWILLCVFLASPYFLGRLCGQVIIGAGQARTGRVFSVLSNLGVFEPPSLWDSTWEQVRRRGSVVLVIQLKDGNSIEGQFANRSKVDFSPRPPRVYLEKAYGYDMAGQRIAFPQGAYVEGDQIVSVQFKN